MSGKKQPRNGKPASMLTDPPLKGNFKFPSPELQRVLKDVYNRYQKLDDPETNRTARRDFVFHMTDWIEDLEQLAALYDHPAKFDKATAGDVVFGFLIHALGHLLAASRLLQDSVCDPFGALESKKQ